MYHRSEIKVRSFAASKWDNRIRYFFIFALIVSLIGYAGGSAAPVRAASNNPMYVSFDGNVTFNGVTFADDDIIRYNGNTWEYFFDGSDVGLGTGPDTTAFTLLDANNGLFVLFDTVPISLNGGALTVTPNDIVRFTATSWGSITSGTFSLFLSGASVGLENTVSERIDALGLLPDGSLLISTMGNPVVPVTIPDPSGGTVNVVGSDEDVLKFTPNTPGDYTSGTWSLYLDGSAIGLSTANDVDAIDVVGSTVYLSTSEPFSAQGVSGGSQDVFSCSYISPTNCTVNPYLYFNSSIFATELGVTNLDAFEQLDLGPIPPKLVSFRLQNPATSPTNANSLVFRATFNEEVTNVNGPDFAVNGTTTATVTNVASVNASVYDVTVSGGNLANFNGVVGLNLSGTQNITDLDTPGNALPTIEPAIDETYTLDNTLPTVSSIVRANPDHTGAANVDFTVTFTENVTGVDTGDFALTTTGVTGASIQSVSGSGSTYTVTVGTGSGNGTIRLDVPSSATITDLVANALGGLPFVSGEVYSIIQDSVSPTVSSIVRANPSPTGAANVDFTVTFTESVTGVDTADFALTTTGTLTGVAIQTVSGSGSTYTVTVGTGSGKGTIRLDVPSSATITDLAANALGGLPFVSGEVYTIVPNDGPDTTGVFRPSNGVIFLKNTNTTGIADIGLNYGIPGDYPVVGDWDGNGTTTIGVYRNGSFYLRNENTIGFAENVFAFGQPGDQPIAGDWNGDGIDTIGVYRPSNGQFLLRNSNDAGAPEINFFLGNVGDVGIAGDWDGDGKDTTGVFRPSNGVIFLKNTNDTGFADVALNYGIPGDKPVTGDWDGDGTDTIGVYRNGQFMLRNSNTVGFADMVFGLGNPGDMPIAGNWDGMP